MNYSHPTHKNIGHPFTVYIETRKTYYKENKTENEAPTAGGQGMPQAKTLGDTPNTHKGHKTTQSYHIQTNTLPRQKQPFPAINTAQLPYCNTKIKSNRVTNRTKPNQTKSHGGGATDSCAGARVRF